MARATHPTAPTSVTCGHERTAGGTELSPVDPGLTAGEGTVLWDRTPALSVLWLAPPAGGICDQPTPSYFRDLRLDQLVNEVLRGGSAGATGGELARRDADLGNRDHLDDDVSVLRMAYCRRLFDPDEVRYRQEVFSDLENPDLLADVSAFAASMRDVHAIFGLAAKLEHTPQADRWHLDAAWSYVRAISALARGLSTDGPRSRALSALSACATGLSESARFQELQADCARVRDQLGKVRYLVHVQGATVAVSELGNEPDLSADVQRTFERFRRGPARDYRLAIRDRQRLDHVEVQVLDRVASLFPSQFEELRRFQAKWRVFIDSVMARVACEVHFYLAYLSWTQPVRDAGLPMCYPAVAWRPDVSSATDSYDLVLARKLLAEGMKVVTNDFSLRAQERLLVVTGPNQGGKTTFARMFGQLHHLAALGCPVPGTHARVRLCDEIFTHFQHEEDPGIPGGRLERDLRRIRQFLLGATADSVLVANEIFTSTTLDDATFLGRKLIERVAEIGLVGVIVTFVDELASLDPSTVSMVSTVEPDDPATRTFKVLRRPADGRSYAAVIAGRYGLSYEQLAARLAR